LAVRRPGREEAPSSLRCVAAPISSGLPFATAASARHAARLDVAPSATPTGSRPDRRTAVAPPGPLARSHRRSRTAATATDQSVRPNGPAEPVGRWYGRARRGSRAFSRSFVVRFDDGEGRDVLAELGPQPTLRAGSGDRSRERARGRRGGARREARGADRARG